MKMRYLIFLCVGFLACKSIPEDQKVEKPRQTPFVMEIDNGGKPLSLVIQIPKQSKVKVMVLFHGTVSYDSLVLGAAYQTLDMFKKIMGEDSFMYVSVAYPEEGLLFGDNVQAAAAAVKWIKESAEKELDIQLQTIFLAGHSQGGYVATRLNTMMETQGVIANAPGPLNLLLRCQLEENGQVPSSAVCDLLRETYGTTTLHPEAYKERSLLAFTTQHQAPILFVQGLDDAPIQMSSWPLFKQKMQACSSCNTIEWVEIPSFGHQAIFYSDTARQQVLLFLEKLKK